MEENVLNQEEEVEMESAADIIADIKANHVPKKKYQDLENEYNKVLKAMARGEEIQVEVEKPVDKDALRLELYTEQCQRLNDVQFIEKTLQLRQAIIDEGGQDPFVPFGTNYGPEESDFATAEKVAQVLQDCVDYADGDNGIFLAELQRRTMDVNPIGSRAKRSR